MGSNSDKRPNVVLFVHDSWRWDVMGHMGNPAAQTLVHEHLVETDAVSFSPFMSPLTLLLSLFKRSPFAFGVPCTGYALLYYPQSDQQASSFLS